MPKPAPYPPTDLAETEAVLCFRRAVSGERVKLEVRERDKIPNIDGYLEIVDQGGVPLGKLDVQIRSISSGNKYSCPVSLVEYSSVTTLPVLLIAVDRHRKTVYWKHISKGMPEFNGKEQQKTFTVKFDSTRDVVDDTEEYISGWLALAKRYQRKLFGLGEIQLTPEEQADSSLMPRALLPTAKEAQALRSVLITASQGLLCWPKTIDGNRWLERPLLQEIQFRVSNTVTSTTMLLGDPGSGKSALLSKLVEMAIDQGLTVLGLKADHLPVEVDSVDALGAFWGLSDCVTQIELMAAVGPVLVVIDQLDALADLVDLKSGRLNAVIQFITQVAGKQNVHLVASCRNFEAEHDPRLRNMQPDVQRRNLDLPPWELIEAVFAESGVITTGWPDTMKQLLRTPQHLMIFLRIVPPKAVEPQIFQSYLAMLHRYWEQQFETLNSTCEDLLLDLAFRMSEREELWLPAAQFNREALKKLEASGFLTSDQDRGRVGFRHQTMFEYARARAFVRSEESLVRHVLQRQDGLFVRPLLWTILPYLRDSNQSVYRRELAGLWHQEIRFHLRVLLIEFLGQLEQPDEFESALLFDYLAKLDYQGIVLMSMANSPGWFARTRHQYLPTLMKQTEEAAGLNFVLQQAITFARDEVLGLMKQIWFPDPRKHYQAIAVLNNLEEWNELAIQIMEAILERTDVAPIWVCAAASAAQKHVPHLAGRLLRAAIQRKLKLAQEDQAKKIAAFGPVDINDEQQRLAREVELRWKSPVREVLDSNEWDCAFELANSSPESFVDELLPVIVDAVSSVAYEEHDVVMKYRGDPVRSNFRYFDNGEESALDDNSLLGALRVSIESLAEKNAERFLELFQGYKSSNLLYVHSLLVGGFLKLGTLSAAIALQYLIEDDRRFFVGYNTDEQSLSRDLIGAIAPNLDFNERKLLEDRITQVSYYRPEALPPDAEAAEGRFKTERRRRMMLLQAFPRECLSDEGRRFLEGEELLFETGETGPNRLKTTLVKSAMSAQEMAIVDTEELQKLLVEVNDQVPDSHPKDWTKGGIFETSREFGELAAKDPQKAMTVVCSLDPVQSTIAAGKAIEGIARSETDSSKLFAFIEQLEERGFQGTEYRNSIAKALAERVQENAPLSEPMILLLEKSLAEVPVASKDVFNRGRGWIVSPQESQKESVLWGRDAEPVPIDASYSIVYTLTLALLQAKPQQPERWLRILESHLRRCDSIDVWCSLSVTYLRFLSLCDHGQAEIFVNGLFELYPGLFDGYYATRLIAQTMGWTSEAFASRWISQISKASWARAAQAFGEVLCLQHLWFQDRNWPRTTIDSVIESKQMDRDILVGIAYVASKLWHHMQFRERASELIEKLLGLDSAEIIAAISTYISNGDSYSVDEYTERVLRRLSDGTEFLTGNSLFNALESMVELTPCKPDFVHELCMKVIKSAGPNIGDIRTSECMLSGPLLDIALRLQRMDDRHRQQGMDIFEGLLRCRAHEVVGLLHTMDGRPKSGSAVRMPRRKPRNKYRQRQG